MLINVKGKLKSEENIECGIIWIITFTYRTANCYQEEADRREWRGEEKYIEWRRVKAIVR